MKYQSIKIIMLVSVFLWISLTLTAKNLTVSKSEVKWTGKKLAYGHHGTIALKSGKIVTDKKLNLQSGEFIIDMTTLKNLDLAESPGKLAKLEGHLKSEDFFAVDKFPIAKFTFNKVTVIKKSENGMTHILEGTFTVRGKSEKKSIEVKVVKSKKNIKLVSSFEFDRTKYDVMYDAGIIQKIADKIISDTIGISFDLTAN